MESKKKALTKDAVAQRIAELLFQDNLRKLESERKAS